MKPSEIMKKRYILKLQEVKRDYEKQTDPDYHEEVSEAIVYSIQCIDLVDKLKEILKNDIHRRCSQNYPAKSIAFAERTLLNKRDQELLDYLKELEV